MSDLIDEKMLSDRQGTHADGCADWGPAHYECAIRERDELRRQLDEARAEREAMAKDAARYRRLRRKVCIIGNEFRLLNTAPTYVAPNAAIELDAVTDAQIEQERNNE